MWSVPIPARSNSIRLLSLECVNLDNELVLFASKMHSGGNHAFFNASSGDVWEYGDHGNFRNHYKVREFGKDHDRGR